MSTYYSEDHEWIKVEGDIGTVGISDYAQNALGDIVFVELPDVGASFAKGDDAAVVESVKVPHPHLGEDLVAALHLVHAPLQRPDHLPRIGHHRHDEVRQLVVHLHLDDLRVDHDEAQFIWAKLEEHRSDD